MQNGVVIPNSVVSFPGFEDVDSLSDDYCADIKDLFEEHDHHQQQGGVRGIGEALRRWTFSVLQSIAQLSHAFIQWN